MQITVELPAQLAQQLELYLQTHPQETLVSVVQEALKLKLRPKNTAKLLTLAGIVEHAPRYARDQADNAGKPEFSRD